MSFVVLITMSAYLYSPFNNQMLFKPPVFNVIRMKMLFYIYKYGPPVLIPLRYKEYEYGIGC